VLVRIAIGGSFRWSTSHDTARLFRALRSGVIRVENKADLNVIDMDALALHAPRMVYDRPAGCHRLVQGASASAATIVNGVVTRRDGVDTGGPEHADCHSGTKGPRSGPFRSAALLR
jgi:N-acyl-D-aspartate/D-glutamate deacylase